MPRLRVFCHARDRTCEDLSVHHPPSPGPEAVTYNTLSVVEVDEGDCILQKQIDLH